jgi:hypothetical protein
MPDEDGLNYSEPVGGGYSRVTVDPSFFSTSTQMRVENILTVSFPVSSQPWGTIVGSAIFEMNGTLAWASQFPIPIDVSLFKQPIFRPGKLKFYVGAIPDGCYMGGQRIYENPVLLEPGVEVALSLEPNPVFEYPVEVVP